VLGWLNRDGPGEVCTTSAHSVACSQEWTPWPFWLTGTLLIAIPVIVFARRQQAPHRVPTA
jgi:hypothetical protein